MQKLVRQAAAKCGRTRLIVEASPKFSSQSVGGVGRCQRELGKMIRTWKADVQLRTGVALLTESVVWPWLVRHAAWVLMRFRTKGNGKTQFEDAYGCKLVGGVLPFATAVLYREPFASHRCIAKGLRAHNGDLHWQRGLWLGRTSRSNEVLVGTPTGVVASRSVRLVPDLGKEAAAELIRAMIGIPWNTVRGRMGRPRAPIIGLAPGALMGETTAASGGSTDPQQSDGAEAGAEGAPAAQQAPDDSGASATSRSLSGTEEASEPKRHRSDGAASSSGAAGGTTRPRSPGDGDDVGSARSQRREEPMVTVESRPTRPRQESDGEPESQKRPRLTVAGINALWTNDAEAERPQRVSDEDRWYDTAPGNEGEGVTQAQWSETDRFIQYGVFVAVPRSAAHGKFISTKWVQTVKDDGSCRARFVAREFRSQGGPRTDTFAAASSQATNTIADHIAEANNWPRMIADVEAAYLHVPIQEAAHVQPPAVWLEAEAAAGRPIDVVWQLQKELYGKRVAGSAWFHWLSNELVKLGFALCGSAVDPLQCGAWWGR